MLMKIEVKNVLKKLVVCVEYVGLSLSYGLPLNSVLYYAVLLGCMLENKMVSVERIKQFINIPSEAPWTIPDSSASPDWPNRGDINIRDLKVCICSRLYSSYKNFNSRIEYLVIMYKKPCIFL